MADRVIPYAKAYEHITDISRFFREDASTHTVTFIGKTLEVRIPKRFEVYGLLNISDTIQTLAVMDLIIDDTYQTSMHLLAVITMNTSATTQITIGGITYIVATLAAGDVFIANTTVVKDKSTVGGIYTEFIDRGNLPYWFTYAQLMKLFDQMNTVADAGMRIDPVIFEVSFSHLARDPKDLYRPFRYLQKPDAPFTMVGLRSVELATSSTSARLLGSYFSDGLNASLTHQVTERQPFEDLLRGLSTESTAQRQTPQNRIRTEAWLTIHDRVQRSRVEVFALGANNTMLARLNGTSYPLVPGGGVDQGETLDQAAARELMEEAGWTATGYTMMNPSGVWIYRGPKPVVNGWQDELCRGMVCRAQAFSPTVEYGAHGDGEDFSLISVHTVLDLTRKAIADNTLEPRFLVHAQFRLAVLEMLAVRNVA